MPYWSSRTVQAISERFRQHGEEEGSEGDVMKEKVKYIDVEPTWCAILKMVERGAVKANELKPVCELADKIRQAQKKGAVSVEIFLKGHGLRVLPYYDNKMKKVI